MVVHCGGAVLKMEFEAAAYIESIITKQKGVNAGAHLILSFAQSSHCP